MKATENNASFKKNIAEYAAMTAGALIMAAGVYFFKIPNGFSTGGVSGIATVLGGVISFVTPATMISIINVVLLLIGFVFIGRETGLRTVFCSIAFSVFTWLFEFLFPLSSPLTDQPFLELVYAILLTGVGSAIMFYCDASSGGTDIVALILKKYTSVNVGIALLITDFLISASAFLVFDLKTGLYSLLGLFAKSFLVDSVIQNLNVCKAFTVITEKPEPIVDYIINEMKHSATSYDAEGEYTHSKKKVIVTLCKRREAVRLKKKIQDIDPGAFVIVEHTSEIIGRGFRMH